jgi:hypothetical protein
MWVVLFACLAPSPNDSQSAEGATETDTADTASQTDDSTAPATDDTSPDDDSAVVRGEDTGDAPGADTADSAAPGSCDWMSWDNVGQPYFKTWCTACHSADLDEAKRQGAPADCNLDTYEDVVAWAPAIRAKLTAGTMPPTGTPPQDIEGAVLEWLDCGTPR